VTIDHDRPISASSGADGLMAASMRSDDFTGKPATQILVGPVFALVSPGDGPTKAYWMGVVGQGFQLYGGTSEQTSGCSYTVDFSCTDAGGSDAYGV
jgi:hypothetical protein